MSANERPGGWVEGIGWVAIADPAVLDGCTVAFNVELGDAAIRMSDSLPMWLTGRLVAVHRWADGTEPAPMQGPPLVSSARPWVEEHVAKHRDRVYLNPDVVLGWLNWIDAQPGSACGVQVEP